MRLVNGGRGDGTDDGRLGVAAQGRLENPRQLGVPEGDEVGGLAELVDDHGQLVEALVDAARFL